MLKKRVLSALTALVLASSIVVGGSPLKTKAEVNLDLGQIGLNKEVTTTDQEGVYDVKLSVNGADVVARQQYNDIVLLIETSYGINDVSMESSKEGAKKFVDTILSASPNNRIALVPFSNAGLPVSDFTNDKQLLIDEISSFTSTGSVFLQEALKSANDLITGPTARPQAEKFVIVFGRGKAYEFYNPIYDTNDFEVVYDEQHSWESHKVVPKHENISPIGYDYSKIYDPRSGTEVTLQCEICGDIGYRMHRGENLASDTTAYEADKLKPNASVYTIGLAMYTGTDEELRYEYIQNSGFYNAHHYGQIEYVYDQISSKMIKDTGSEFKVEDVLGKDFTLVPDSIQSTIGNVSYDESTSKITWNMEPITGKEEITLNYKIKVKEGTKNGVLSTSESTKLYYVDYVGRGRYVDFPVKNAIYGKVSNVTIKYVDENNKEIDQARILVNIAVGDTIKAKDYIKTIKDYELASNNIADLIVVEDATKNVITIKYKKIIDKNPATGENNGAGAVAVATMVALVGSVVLKKKL